LRETVATTVPEILRPPGAVECWGRLRRHEIAERQQLESVRRAMESSSVHKG
jgi:hypothetical protein